VQLSDKDVQRFWSKVHICDHGKECRNCHWMWKSHTRGVDKRPSFTVYKTDEKGIVHYEGKRYQFYAHRIMYFLVYNIDAQCVYYKCYLDKCVQPAHLSLTKKRAPILEIAGSEDTSTTQNYHRYDSYSIEHDPLAQIALKWKAENSTNSLNIKEIINRAFGQWTECKMQ